MGNNWRRIGLCAQETEEHIQLQTSLHTDLWKTLKQRMTQEEFTDKIRSVLRAENDPGRVHRQN